MVKVVEFAKTILDFTPNIDFHTFCRQIEGILLEITLLLILVVGLLRILRALINDERHR
jgi:hypothetical protein